MNSGATVEPNLTEEANIKSILRAKEICEAHNVKLTRLREQVLTLLLRHGKPLGAYALMDLLAENSERERVAPPTVYRTLDFLLKYRLIHKIHSLNAYVINQYPKREDSSVILICTNCGIAEEVPNNSIQQAINLSASQHRFSVEKQVIEISGKCGECRLLERRHG